MELSDIPAVCEIEKQTGVCVWGVEGYREALSNEYVGLVYEKCGLVVGFIVAKFALEEVEILNLAVAPEWQRCGVGSQLVEACKELAKSKGVREIWLDVRKSNLKARSFYEKHGFSVVFERRRFYRNPDEDAVVMMCRIE
jgi:ribosomal-protein-alanine N-acetyltransferase